MLGFHLSVEVLEESVEVGVQRLGRADGLLHRRERGDDGRCH